MKSDTSTGSLSHNVVPASSIFLLCGMWPFACNCMVLRKTLCAMGDKEGFWWGGLPAEIQMLILSHLPAAALFGCLQVNSAWHHMAKDDSIWKACFRKHFPGYPLPSPSAEGSSWFLETAKMAKGLAPITWDSESSAKSFDFDKANKLATRTKGTGPKYPKTISFMPIDLKKKHEFAFLLKGHAILGLYSTSSKVDLHQELNVAGEAKDPAELVKSRVLEASVIFTRTKKHHYFENYRWDARGSSRDNYLCSPRSLMGLFDKNPGGVLCELRIQNEKVTWHLAGKEVADFTFKPTQTFNPPPTIETYLVYCNSAPGSSLESIPPLYRK